MHNLHLCAHIDISAGADRVPRMLDPPLSRGYFGWSEVRATSGAHYGRPLFCLNPRRDCDWILDFGMGSKVTKILGFRLENIFGGTIGIIQILL